MNRRLAMLAVAIVIFGLIATIGSAVAADYIWIESNLKGVGWKNVDYTVDTRPGVASGVEMRELESGSGIVTAQKWTLEVNMVNPHADCANCFCLEGLEEHKIFDVEYFPITYQNLSYDQKWLEKKCVKNYEIGAVTDAFFDMCERLEKEETVVTYTGYESAFGGLVPLWIDYNDDESPAAALTQTVTADVLGRSHIGFAAKQRGIWSNHRTIAMGVEETVGDFHIEKTIDIRETCREGMVGDWLGCP
jgi:hypothetical protein